MTKTQRKNHHYDLKIMIGSKWQSFTINSASYDPMRQNPYSAPSLRVKVSQHSPYVEPGSGDTELFREKMAGAENERAELIERIDAQEAQVKEALTPITLDQAKIASGHLKRLLHGAPIDLKKRYVCASISEIIVGKSEVVISGPKDALAEAVSGEPLANLAAAAGPVRSLVREWRTGGGEKQYWSAVRLRERKTA